LLHGLSRTKLDLDRPDSCPSPEERENEEVEVEDEEHKDEEDEGHEDRSADEEEDERSMAGGDRGDSLACALAAACDAAAGGGAAREAAEVDVWPLAVREAGGDCVCVVGARGGRPVYYSAHSTIHHEQPPCHRRTL